MSRRFAAFLLVCLALFTAAGALSPASAEPPAPDKCFDSGPNYELPTCTWDGTQWSVSYEDGPLGLDGGQGIPAGFVGVFVLALLVGVGGTIWRVSTARQMAKEAGMDPERAAAMTLLSDDGLDATYIASSIRGSTPAEPSSPAPVRSADERLREVARLRDEGLVTAEEYDARRAAILDSL